MEDAHKHTHNTDNITRDGEGISSTSLTALPSKEAGQKGRAVG